MTMADEACVKHCHFRRKKVERPVLYGGFVFCSMKCLEQRGKPVTGTLA